MVSTSKFLFKIPGQTSFMGLESLEKKKHLRPDTLLTIKDIGVCRNKKSHGYGECLGTLPYCDIKMKYSKI
jgi:hypothetical protein